MGKQADTVRSLPQTEATYLRFRRLLFGALANLARQGFVAPPTEGLDLIQDFFTEAWSGICSRHDPTKGKFDTYVYGAFVRFARPRILRLNRWQSYLVDTIDLARTLESQSNSAVPHELWHDVSAVRDALVRLPPFEREVLNSYLLADAPSERRLAEKFSISRYRLRETLVEALGHLTALLDEPGRIPENDWKVALALWQEGRTIPQAAVYLGQTVQQVREARSRLTTLLAEGLKIYQSTTRSQYRGRTVERDTHTLLEKTLTSPGNRKLLEEVHARANEILDYLEHSESLEELEKQMLAGDPEWIAEVYGAIAGEEEFSPEDLAMMETLSQANIDQEIQIGYAFKDVLMPDLPPRLQDFRSWFKSLPEVREDERKDLNDNPVVQASRPYSEQLIPYGITPLTIFYSTEAISMLLERLRHQVIPPNHAVVIGLGAKPPQKQLTMVVHEIASVAECSELAAQLLLPWLVEVARYKPLLFSGFRARPIAIGIHLVRDPKIDNKPYERWGFKSTPYKAKIELNEKNIQSKFRGVWGIVTSEQSKTLMAKRKSTSVSPLKLRQHNA
jgi:RNA polymerase sigma factor (sigma-70 family)